MILTYIYINKKHIDASVKERPQPHLVPSEKKIASVFYAINIFNTIYFFKTDKF